jgi:hypothetical protein
MDDDENLTFEDWKRRPLSWRIRQLRLLEIRDWLLTEEQILANREIEREIEKDHADEDWTA